MLRGIARCLVFLFVLAAEVSLSKDTDSYQSTAFLLSTMCKQSLIENPFDHGKAEL